MNARPRMLGEALVESNGSARRASIAFGRMHFPVDHCTLSAEGDERLTSILIWARRACRGTALHLQSWAADTEDGSPLHAEARRLETLLPERLPELEWVASASEADRRGGVFLQLCVISPTCIALGKVRPGDAASWSPGGRERMSRIAEAPSRASMKLEEALTRLRVTPGRGDLCADLGAAPGGWTQRLVARGARVIAVDPAKLLPALAQDARVEHVQASAFSFQPEEPVDWLFCDMAWRPLEVAELLGKWARKRWATHLVANIKLPMKDKNPILVRVRHTLETSGWNALQIRQLYHDRDEVTVTAHRGG